MGSEVGWMGIKSFKMEPGRFFSSLSPNSLQGARHLSSVSALTYLVRWITSIPAPGSESLGPESPSSKNVKGIMSLITWSGTKSCFAKDQKNFRVFLQVPMRLKSSSTSNKKKMIFVVVVVVE